MEGEVKPISSGDLVGQKVVKAEIKLSGIFLTLENGVKIAATVFSGPGINYEWENSTKISVTAPNRQSFKIEN